MQGFEVLRADRPLYLPTNGKGIIFVINWTATIGDSIFVTNSIGVATSLMFLWYSVSATTFQNSWTMPIFLLFIFYMSYQSPSSFTCTKHLLATNATSVFRHSKNNCSRVHPFPNAFCKRIVSLQILVELISTHLCIWHNVYGKTNC